MNKQINIRVNEEFKEILEQLIKIKKMDSISEMIRVDYSREYEVLSNLANNHEYVNEFLPQINYLFQELLDSQKEMIGSDEEIENDVLMYDMMQFIFDYMMTNPQALASLYNKFLIATNKKQIA